MMYANYIMITIARPLLGVNTLSASTYPNIAKNENKIVKVNITIEWLLYKL